MVMRAGQGRPRLYLFLCLFPLFFPFVFLFPFVNLLWRKWGKETTMPYQDGMVACGLLQVTPVGDREVGKKMVCI